MVAALELSERQLRVGRADHTIRCAADTRAGDGAVVLHAVGDTVAVEVLVVDLGAAVGILAEVGEDGLRIGRRQEGLSHVGRRVGRCEERGHRHAVEVPWVRRVERRQQRELGAVAAAVGVGIGGKRVRVEGVDLLPIRQAVTVRVGLERVRMVTVHFLSVRQPVTVGVGISWIGVVRVDFEPVRDAIAIGVSVVRIREEDLLVGVAQAVAILVACTPDVEDEIPRRAAGAADLREIDFGEAP